MDVSHFPVVLWAHAHSGAWPTDPALLLVVNKCLLQGFDKVVPPFEALLKFHGGGEGFEEVVPFPKRIGTLHV